MKILIRVFLFSLFSISSFSSAFSQTGSKETEESILVEMISQFNSGLTGAASKISDSLVNATALSENAKFWFYCGLINKEMFKKHEKSNPKSPYREKSTQAFLNALDLEKDPDLISEIKKNLKYVSSTYFNDAVRLLGVEEKESIEQSTYTLRKFIGIMQRIEEDFSSRQIEVDFTGKLGEIYGRMYEKETETNEYYELAKNCYQTVLNLDPNQKTAKYNLVVLETKYKSRQEQLLKEESKRKDQEIVELNAVKELAVARLRESRLEEEAKKKELIILRSQQDINDMKVKTEQERKDTLVEKEKQKQRFILYAVIIGLVIVLILAGFILRNNLQKQKANRIIQTQKEEVEASYQNTKLMSDIGQKITASLSVDDIVAKVYETLNQLMDATVFGIAIFNKAENRLDGLGLIEKGEKMPFYYFDLADETRTAVWCFNKQSEVFINDYEKDYVKYFPGKKVPAPITGEQPESMIYFPLSVPNKKIGVVTVQSFSKNAYKEYHLNILRNLAIYVSIALDNSQAYNKLNYALNEVKKLSIVASETKNSVIICNKDMELEWVNDTFVEIQGFSLEEFKREKGKTLTEVSSAPNLKKLVGEAIEKKTSIVYNSLNTTKLHGDRWFQTTLTPVFDEENNLQNIVILDADITDLKNIEEEIRQKNKDITDSIQYAKRIQQSILPSQKKINGLLPDSFIFYLPKDIVSGDFYWLDGIEDNSKIIITAVDCTGHGVPGALLTMIGNSLLNHIVNETNIYDPKQILTEMNSGIIGRFDLIDEATSRDGMDMSLCTITKNEKEFVLDYSGAFNPLYYISNNELTELGANRHHIGSISDEQKKNMISHRVEIKKGDVFYLFSDGFADQLSGETEKKFMKGRFKQLLLDIHKKPMSEQKKILETVHLQWKGSIFQTDDILVIGFRF